MSPGAAAEMSLSASLCSGFRVLGESDLDQMSAQNHSATGNRTDGATEETAVIWAATLNVSHIWYAVELHLSWGLV